MDGHLRTFTIDGLNLDELEFNWKNRLIIFHSKGSNENIVNVHVVIPRPFKVRPMGEELSDEENESQGEAFEIVAVFLYCYHLSNDLNMPKIITDTWTGTDLKLYK